MGKGLWNLTKVCNRFIEKLEDLNFVPVHHEYFMEVQNTSGEYYVTQRFIVPTMTPATLSYFFSDIRPEMGIHFLFSQKENRFICRYDPKTGIIYHPNFNTNAKRLTVESLMILYNGA